MKRWPTVTISVLAALILVAAPRADALEPGPFGWRRSEALGSRPLLVIWVREPDGSPASELAGRKQYYEDIVFGRPSGTSSYPASLRQLEPNLFDFYRDASGGRFTWTHAGFVGPVAAPVKGKSPTDIARLALEAAAHEGHVNFRAFEVNHDGTIAPNQLAVLIIVNSSPGEGQANHFRGNRSFKIPGQNVTFAGADGVTGEGGTLRTKLHELFHGLGGLDIYGHGAGATT
jgi:hypothetical protein